MANPALAVASATQLETSQGIVPGKTRIVSLYFDIVHSTDTNLCMRSSLVLPIQVFNRMLIINSRCPLWHGICGIPDSSTFSFRRKVICLDCKRKSYKLQAGSWFKMVVLETTTWIKPKISLENMDKCVCFVWTWHAGRIWGTRTSFAWIKLGAVTSLWYC